MLSKRDSVLMLFAILSLLCVSSVAGVSVSAQETHTYGVFVRAGDSADYAVETANAGLVNGDILRYVVQEIEPANITGETNSDILGYEQPDCNCYVFYAGGLLGQLIGTITFPIPTRSNSLSLRSLEVPFFPMGSGFWEALSGLFPSLKVSFSSYENVLTTDFSWHGGGSIGNPTANFSENILYHAHCVLTIKASGIMTEFQESVTEVHTSNFGYNFTQFDYFSLSLVNESIASMISPGVSMSLVTVVSAPVVGLVAVVYLLDVRRSKRTKTSDFVKVEKSHDELRGKGSETVKSRLLDGLSYQTLLRVAESVSGDVGEGTTREALVRTIKDSMSVEEIKKKIAEPI
jgi:hypothetical protein